MAIVILNESRDSQSPGSSRGSLVIRILHSRSALVIAGCRREVALSRGAYGSCRRGLLSDSAEAPQADPFAVKKLIEAGPPEETDHCAASIREEMVYFKYFLQKNNRTACGDLVSYKLKIHEDEKDFYRNESQETQKKILFLS
jgi:hypothetical protein